MVNLQVLHKSISLQTAKQVSLITKTKFVFKSLTFTKYICITKSEVFLKLLEPAADLALFPFDFKI